MTNVFITNLALPFTGVFISLLVYLIGMWLFKISNGFFLFTPLLVGMVLGIVILAIWAKFNYCCGLQKILPARWKFNFLVPEPSNNGICDSALSPE